MRRGGTYGYGYGNVVIEPSDLAFVTNGCGTWYHAE